MLKYRFGQCVLYRKADGTEIVKFGKEEVSCVNNLLIPRGEVQLNLRRSRFPEKEHLCMRFEREEWGRDVTHDLRMWAFGQDVPSMGMLVS